MLMKLQQKERVDEGVRARTTQTEGGQEEGREEPKRAKEVIVRESENKRTRGTNFCSEFYPTCARYLWETHQIYISVHEFHSSKYQLEFWNLYPTGKGVLLYLIQLIQTLHAAQTCTSIITSLGTNSQDWGLCQQNGPLSEAGTC